MGNFSVASFLLVFSLSSFAIRPSGTHMLDGTQALRQMQKARGDNPGVSPSTQTIPYWSDSFTYQGLVFPFKMVGSDPKLGSRTTIVPTTLIPLRFVFSDGQVFDASLDEFEGQTAIQGILRSPIFQNYPFIINGTNVGMTQYGDAYQRANFWNSVSTRSPQYHVLLQPTVIASQTIAVPANMGAYGIDPGSGIMVPYVDETFLGDQERMLRNALHISPKVLSIAIRGRVMAQSSAFPGEPSAIAWHGREGTPLGIRTFIASSYSDAFFPDVYPLSHEVAEWLNDPFADNYTPGWNFAFLEPIDRCDSGSVARGLLETADPVEYFREAIVRLPGAFNYHVTEAMFLDYYTRQSPSRSVNGQYSLFTIGTIFGLPSEPSSPCVGSVQISRRVIDVPGSIQVSANGVNDQGDAVGYFVDAQNITHGFLQKNGALNILDFPGTLFTNALQVNGSDQVVGYFYDSFGVAHGFLFSNNKWTQIDYPGAKDTIVTGINASGEMTGVYNYFHAVAHGFTLDNRKFTTVDAPFAPQSVVNGINDLGVLVGYSWDDPVNGPVGSFLANGNQFTHVDMPMAQFTFVDDINNSGMISGVFQNIGGYISGFVKLFGFLHEVNDQGQITIVNGNNNLNQVAGQTYDFTRRKWVGFVGTLPTH